MSLTPEFQREYNDSTGIAEAIQTSMRPRITLKRLYDAETVALSNDLFHQHDCRDYSLMDDDHAIPQTADDCEVCWLANK